MLALERLQTEPTHSPRCSRIASEKISHNLPCVLPIMVHNESNTAQECRLEVVWEAQSQPVQGTARTSLDLLLSAGENKEVILGPELLDLLDEDHWVGECKLCEWMHSQMTVTLFDQHDFPVDGGVQCFRDGGVRKLELSLGPEKTSAGRPQARSARPTIALVGTSPVTVLEAARYQKAGYDVTIFEDALSAGGSWRVLDLPYFKDVPLGPHTINAYPAAYNVLRNGLKLAMEPAQMGHWYRTPTPVLGRLLHALEEGWLTRFKTVEQCKKLNALLAKRFPGWSYEAVMDAMAQHNNKEGAALFEGESKSEGITLEFPEGGTVALCDSLNSFIARHELKVHYGVRLQDYPVVHPNGVEVTLSNGTSRMVDQLVVNSRAKLSGVKFGKAKFPLKFNRHRADMAWLVVNELPVKDFRVELRTYPPIWRVAHVTHEASARSDHGASLFTIAGHRDADLKDLTGPQIVSILQEDGILSSSAEALYYTARTSSEDWLSVKMGEQLEARSHGRLVYLYTHNLGRSLAQHAPLWANAELW